MRRDLSAETLAAQGAGDADPAFRGIVPPIHPATAYEIAPDGGSPADRAYTRADNPTYDHAEQLLARLEGGAGCALFASGSAAAAAVFQCLVPGDHVLVARILYWGIRKWLAEFAVTWGLDVEFVDTTDAAAVAAAVRPGRTRLLWLETPANPTWEVCDLHALSEIAHTAGVRVAVDSTVATPVLTRPIEHGADLVVHSATKYLNGHSDVLAGAVVTACRDPFWERLRSWRRNGGAVLGPFEAWLLQRGLRTLFVRVRRQSETALALARYFERHPALAAVLYPGLPAHPGHDIAARQMSGGFGGMLSIRVRNGEAAAKAVAAAAQVFKRTTSLGGVESLIEHRRSTEGPSSPVPGDLLRLSIGLEAPEDLIADLEAALDAATRSHPTGAPASDTARPDARPAERAHPGAAPVPPPAGSTATAPPDDFTAAVAAVLERSVAPLVIARGGAIRLAAARAGIVTLEASGSPGAILPLAAEIEALLRASLPEVTAVRLVWPETKPAPEPTPAGLVDRIRQILNDEVNPAVAAHGGRVTLVDTTGGTVRLRLEGGCQGCGLAEVTVRQGIEPLLRTRLPAIVAVLDVTDHQAGTSPFFPPAKR
ncbi:MAG TPA: PLP-dependent transferase [Dehalococcoidia bacterium]|nr:PLP-dependent transferase [Dehalococcoidia bacterium]